MTQDEQNIAAAQSDQYESRPSRSSFWARVAAAVAPKTFAADDPDRQASPTGSYSVRPPNTDTGGRL